MKILVCGSRTWINRDVIREKLSDFTGDVTVIHGGARGADSIAAEVSCDYGFEVITFYANWEKWGRFAGVIRNLQMLEENPDLVIAFWDGVSRGTAHTIKEAKKRKIPVNIVRSKP